MAQQNQPYLTFNNGNKIPQVGYGTFQSKNEQVLIDCIKKAYQVGIRHFDTAQGYENEQFIGKALNELFQSGVKREELFITTKYLNFKQRDGKLRNPIDELKISLNKLNLQYVDLYLIHWTAAPMQMNPEQNLPLALNHRPIHEIWAEFEECFKLGLCKNIGISNFNVQSILDLLSYCKVKPVMNQIELSPFLIQDGLIDCCNKFDIKVTSYSSLARGGLETKTCFGEKVDVFNQPLLKELALKYNKSIGQICLAFWVQQGVCVIPKSENLERIKENFEVFSWELSKEDVEKFKTLNTNKPGVRCINPKLLVHWGYLSIFE